MKGYPQMYHSLEYIRRDLLRKIDEPSDEDLQAIYWALEEAYRTGHKLLHQPPGYTHLVEQNLELKQQINSLRDELYTFEYYNTETDQAEGHQKMTIQEARKRNQALWETKDVHCWAYPLSAKLREYLKENLKQPNNLTS